MRVGVSALVGVWLLSNCNAGDARDTNSEVEVSAHVRLATLARRDVVQSLSLYGVVVSGPESAHASSVPYDSVIARVFVREGQPVALGDPLVEVEPSRDARLALSQARASASTAEAALESVRSRLASGLATRGELAAAEREVRSASLEAHSLVARGVGRRREIRAAGPGVVRTIRAGVGDVVASNASVVDLDLAQRLEVRVKLDLQDVALLAAGDTVVVSDLGLPPTMRVDAVVRVVGQSVNGDTRQVDLYAALPEGSGLLLNQRVVASLDVHSGPVLVVPRKALVPLPDGIVLFTVDPEGLAHAHRVRVGLETDRDAEISGASLTEGARVVVAGAAVLSDGMHTVEDPG